METNGTARAQPFHTSAARRHRFRKRVNYAVHWRKPEACGTTRLAKSAAFLSFDDMNRCISHLWLVALVVFELAVASSHAADWPQYRGPQASGVDASKPLPTEWNIATGKNVRWQTPLPGLAHASPIVSGDRIYVATVVGPSDKELKVGLCGDIAPMIETGSNQWRLLYSPYLWADKSNPATVRRFYRAVEFAAPTNLVFIPPGTFRMGSPTNEVDRFDWECHRRR